MKKILLTFIVFTSVIFPQNSNNILNIPRDTSYTIYSATVKIHKNFPNAVPASSELPSGIKEIKNLVYVSYGKRALRLDLFMPSTMKNTPYPAVLMIHGGGWASGNRTMTYPMAEKLAEDGYITAAAEYRLSPEAKYPASIYDLKAAVRWLRANAAGYDIDTNKIAVYGCSSGGHLAAFIGTTNGNKKFEGTAGNLLHSSDVEAAIDVDGILDFTTPAESGHDNNPNKPSPGKKWLGASIKDNPGIWREASPINYIGPQTAPMLFVNSSKARFHAGRDSVMHMMKKYGIYSEKHMLPGTVHTFWLFHPWFDKTFIYVHNFLVKVFKRK